MNIQEGLNVPLSNNIISGGNVKDEGDGSNKMYHFGQIDPSLMPFFNIAESKVNKPNFEKSVNYEKEVSLAKKAYEVFLSFLKEISFEKEMIEQRVRHYENIYHKIEKTVRPRKKNRRTSSAIIRNYVCPYQNCRKRYGSDVSLNLHIKRKHNGGNKSERELFAVFYHIYLTSIERVFRSVEKRRRAGNGAKPSS